MVKTWSRTLDDLPRDGRAHDRRPRRPQARAGVRLRVDGRPQARRVRADPHLPRPLRRGRRALAMAARPRPDAPTVAREGALRARVARARRASSPTRSAASPSSEAHDAAALLAARRRRATSRKLLDSAAANAENNHDLDRRRHADRRRSRVDEGPTMQALARPRPRPRDADRQAHAATSTSP